MRTSASDRRAGFTLIELLVVIAIIIALIALTVGTYFRVRVAQERGTTEAMVGKIASSLDRQVKAVIDQANEDWRSGNVPNSPFPASNLILIANPSPPVSDVNRARILYIKMRIKQEFPANFTEAQSAVLLGPVTIGGTQYSYQLPAKANYIRILGAASGGSAFDQSAACLKMALGVARRGEAPTNDEAVGARGNKSLTFGTVTLPVFADAWGSQLGYCRWPTGCTELSDVPYTGTDPQDPQGLLYGPWINSFGSGDQATIQTQLHSLMPIPPGGVPPLRNRNMTPVAISMGPNQKPDINNLATLDDIGVSDDNVYSFRVRR
jgi:prepilin-type N-terminal cleavage/methylation domain-containing protein